MKVIAVALLLFTVNVELGFAQLLNCLNPLDVHCMNNCGADGPNGEPSEAFMGPCYDTPTCKIPMCCGIISGRDSLFRIVYKAAVPFRDGTFNGNLGGIGLGTAVRGSKKNLISINLPGFQLLFPPSLAGYNQTLHTQTTCPQRVGQTYTLDIPFRFVTTAVTSLGIKADFVAQIITDCGQCALCWGLWATLVNVDLVKSVKEVVSDITSDPVKFALNPFPTLGKPLVGLVGGKKNKNPFAGPAPCVDEAKPEPPPFQCEPGQELPPWMTEPKPAPYVY